MSISAPKSTVTLFTPWTRQVNHQLDVSINQVPVPTVKNPRLLGVVFDPTFSFSAHAGSVARKAASRLSIMRALSDTSFGQDKECLLMTFKMFIRSLFNNAAAIVFPNYSSSSIQKLQRIQNRALRLALGCHTAASFAHIHNEALELPVENHMRLISAQFLARALQTNHPSHHHVKQDQGRRPMKQTLQSKVLDDVRPYLDADGNVAPGDFQRVKTAIHTDIVATTIGQLGSSRVLNARPPPIAKSETSLPRLVRTTLSQLRSGFCARLRSFQFRIGKEDNDLCPECGAHPHGTAHLFQCASHPTQLSIHSLWTDPWAVASYLKTTPSFSFFPDIGTPPQRRLRRRRPPPDPPPLQVPDSPVFSPLSLPSPFLFTPPGTPPGSPRRVPRLMSLVIPTYSPVSSAPLSPSSSTSRSTRHSLSQAPRDAGSDWDGSQDLFESD